MNSKIIDYARALDQVSRERRRDFHRYAETAWMEISHNQQDFDRAGI